MSNILIKVDCVYNDKGAWCNNKNVKRSLFGIGARVCVKYPPSKKSCDFIKRHKRPILPPLPIQK